jgi:hypothetical protein
MNVWSGVGRSWKLALPDPASKLKEPMLKRFQIKLPDSNWPLREIFLAGGVPENFL